MPRQLLKWILRTVLIVLLTVLTQVGGLIYLLSLLLNRLFGFHRTLERVGLAVTLYLVVTLLIIPPIARGFGRLPITHNARIGPANYVTVLLNRNYVTPPLNQLLQRAAARLRDSPVRISYLDANFPFVDNFPLLPHLSHDDGRKVDLALIYEDAGGNITARQKSVSGYGVYAGPVGKERDQTRRCKEQGYYQYDYSKYATLGSINGDLQFSVAGTRTLVQSLLQQPALGKILIEPHLKNRLRLKHGKIRFQGCRSVRHDDHIHVQL